MKKTIFIIIMCFMASISLAEGSKKEIVIQGYTPKEYVRAIFLAEGGDKAQYLYGIRSIKYKDRKEAKNICHTSVLNNYKRWCKKGQKGCFLTFLGKRYCPINAKNDPKGLNVHWVKNVKYFLSQS